MAPVCARAAVAVLVEQPYGKLNLFNPGGHSAVYLDHVCAESPLKLRPCRPGELGMVISRYDGIGGYDWVAMPLVVISPEATAVVLAAYVGHGRFRMPKNASPLNLSTLDPNGDAAQMTVVGAISNSSPAATAAHVSATEPATSADKAAAGSQTSLRDEPHNP